METVKMSNVVQVKTRTTANTSSSSSVTGNDAFLKLLQQKKEATEPETDKTEGGKGLSNRTEEKKEDLKVQDQVSKDPEDKKLQEPSEQEALMQASIQQAAAMVTENVTTEEPSQPVQVQEVVAEAVMAENVAPVQEKRTQEPKQEQPSQVIPEKETPVLAEAPPAENMAKPVEKKEEIQNQNLSPKQQESQDNKTQSPTENLSPQSRREEVLAEKPIQASTGQLVQETREPQEEETVQEPMYRTDTVTERTEPIFTSHQTETASLKTTPDTLVQDLGKTLASKLPGSGREMVIELEPAALGKLTIKLAYDGARAAVSILASNPRTAELLSQKASELASILEEKTGQETIIYTQAPEKENQEPEQNPNHGNGGQGERQDRRDSRQEQHQTESFAQQLRLGLV